MTKILDDGNKARSTNLDQIRATRLEKKKQDRLTVSFLKISMNKNIIIRCKLAYYWKNRLVHGNKAKLENFRFRFAAQ